METVSAIGFILQLNDIKSNGRDLEDIKRM